MKTVFVIGAGGFVGQHLVRHLAASGLRVIATARPGRALILSPGVEWIAADLSVGDTSNWPAHYETLIYLAQSSKWRDFPAGAEDVVRVNVGSVLQAAEHARNVGAKRFLHMSTGSVYPQTRVPSEENDSIPVAATRSFYVASKLAAELMLGPYSAYFGLTHLRLFMPYGPGENEKMLIPRLLSKIRGGEAIDLHGSDGLLSNPIYVEDVAEATRRCLALDGTQTLNLGGPEVLSLRQVAEAIGLAIGKRPEFHLKPEAAPTIAGDISRLKTALAWIPPTRFGDGVKLWLG